MLLVSKITGKGYHPDNEKSVVYVTNLRQVGAYLQNGGGSELLDILYDGSKGTGQLVFVFARNNVTRTLYEAWNRHELEY